MATKLRRQYIRNHRFLGFLGFLGFMGITYFTEQKIDNLFMISFFSFFSFFFFGKLASETPDERYLENAAKARAKAMLIPTATIFLIGFCTAFDFITKPLIIIACALAWTATFLTYVILFSYYEKH